MLMFYLFLGFLLNPIIQISVDLLETFAELIKARISVKIMKYNVEITKIKESLEATSVHNIGFALPKKEEEEDYE